MSLSTDPAFSALKNSFVCGVKDISGEPYAGVSGRHLPGGNAAYTTNGAGPHNLQLFVLSPDGVVLTCLPGYWNSQDLVRELDLACKLNQVWQNPDLSRARKDALFSQMHLAHIQEHPPAMVRRSRMQGFDQKYEARRRLYASDCIRDPYLVTDLNARILPQQAFKTTDEIMHERMAARPFVPYQQFDVAAYTDYGRPRYDKQEDYRDAYGNIIPGSDPGSEPLIGNSNRIKQQGRPGYGLQYLGGRWGAARLLRSGISALLQQ